MATTAHPHPKPRQYWVLAVFLGVVTAIEIAVTYIGFLDPIIVPLLIVLSLAKFGTVVGWYMHLRFDKPLYRNFFLIGLVGAAALFLVVLATFGSL